MSIESEFFSKCRIDRAALTAYGFREKDGRLTFQKEMKAGGLLAELFFDSSLTGRVLDGEAESEYTLFRREDAEGFAGEVREEYLALLRDVRKKFCTDRSFAGETAERIAGKIEAIYGCKAEFLWAKYPDYAVFRKEKGGKWFGMIGKVAGEKLEKALKGRGEVEILNLKTEKLSELLSKEGYYPAYHMNKKSWVTLLLDGTLPDGEILARVKESFDLL